MAKRHLTEKHALYGLRKGSQGTLPGLKIHWVHRDSHGGTLRNKRLGRKERKISAKHPIHLVLKCNKESVPGGLRTPKRFKLIHELCDRYQKRFFVKVEQISVQGDHVHLVLRTMKRSGLQNFLRVFSGQIAQRFQKTGLMLLTVPVAFETMAAVDRDRAESIPARTQAQKQKNTPPQTVTGTPEPRAPRGQPSAVKNVTGTRNKRAQLWKYRPFTRVVKGRRAYFTVKDYVQLNEKEAQGLIRYRKERLRGLTRVEYERLWA